MKAILGIAAAAALTVAAPAGAAVHHVRPGESIQRAIDAARAGDTVAVAPGAYRENLTVRDDGIALRGAGAGRGGTVLEPPATPHDSICNEGGEVTGICIVGELDKQTNERGRPVSGTRVSGFSVRGFSRFGVLVANANRTTIARTSATRTRHYGVFALWVKRLRLTGNSSHHNLQGGFYVSDSPDARAVITGNRATGNATSEGIGLYVRDASRGVVRGNVLDANCAGALFVDTHEEGAVTDWLLSDNAVRSNTGACPASEDIPLPLSGLGIGLLGTRRVRVRGNEVSGNRPALDSPHSGGVVLGSSTAFGGDDPVATAVRGNRVTGNAPADLTYDGSGTGNAFASNGCASSEPAGLCAQ